MKQYPINLQNNLGCGNFGLSIGNVKYLNKYKKILICFRIDVQKLPYLYVFILESITWTTTIV